MKALFRPVTMIVPDFLQVSSKLGEYINDEIALKFIKYSVVNILQLLKSLRVSERSATRKTCDTGSESGNAAPRSPTGAPEKRN